MSTPPLASRSGRAFRSDHDPVGASAAEEARSAARRGDFEEVLAWLRRAPEPVDDAGRAQFFALRLHCLNQLGTGPAAQAYHRFVMFWNRNNVAFHLGLAREFVELGQLEGAIEAMRRVLVLTPENAAFRLAYASLLARAGLHREGAAELEVFLAAEAGHPAAELLLAECLEATGRPEAAAAGLRRHLDRLGAQAGALPWLRLARIKAALREDEGAREAFGRAAEISPDDPVVWLAWCDFAAEREDRARVAHCVARLDASAPHDWRCLAGRAVMAELDGEPQRGWELLVSAVEQAARGGVESGAEAARRAIAHAAANAMRGRRAVCEAWMHEFGLHDHATLAALRRLWGIVLDAPVEFTLSVRGIWQQGSAPARACRRRMRVFARDAAEAVRLALAFEECGGVRRTRADLVVREGDGADCFAGPCWLEPERTLVRLPG